MRRPANSTSGIAPERRREKSRAEQGCVAHSARQGIRHRYRNEVASLGIQVHGGMGFIEETGAAQYLPRRAHPADLRRHQRHPGHRSRHAQAAARRRRRRDVVPGRAGRNHCQCPRLEPQRFRSCSATADRSDDRTAIGNAMDGADAAKLAPKRRSRRRRRICD